MLRHREKLWNDVEGRIWAFPERVDVILNRTEHCYGGELHEGDPS